MAGLVGHPKVTARAYAQSRDRLQEASNFACGIVHNVLGQYPNVDDKTLSRLRAQIERDFLVALMEHDPESVRGVQMEIE